MAKAAGYRWSVDAGRVSPTQVALEIYEWLEHLREQVLKEPETASADPARTLSRVGVPICTHLGGRPERERGQ